MYRDRELTLIVTPLVPIQNPEIESSSARRNYEFLDDTRTRRSGPDIKHLIQCRRELKKIRRAEIESRCRRRIRIGGGVGDEHTQKAHLRSRDTRYPIKPTERRRKIQNTITAGTIIATTTVISRPGRRKREYGTGLKCHVGKYLCRGLSRRGVRLSLRGVGGSVGLPREPRIGRSRNDICRVLDGNGYRANRLTVRIGTLKYKSS